MKTASELLSPELISDLTPGQGVAESVLRGVLNQILDGDLQVVIDGWDFGEDELLAIERLATLALKWKAEDAEAGRAVGAAE